MVFEEAVVLVVIFVGTLVVLKDAELVLDVEAGFVVLVPGVGTDTEEVLEVDLVGVDSVELEFIELVLDETVPRWIELEGAAVVRDLVEVVLG